MLRCLESRLLLRGVQFQRRRVHSLSAECGPGRVVVNCTGLMSMRLGDAASYPCRGIVAVVHAPGVQACIDDCEHPQGACYVIPRGDTGMVVCGGTAGDHEWDTSTPRKAEVNAVLARCAELVPALKHAPLLGARAGLRPMRHGGVRLGWDEDLLGLIHCYGHGGAGWTLCWGTAEEVVALVHARFVNPPHEHAVSRL